MNLAEFNELPDESARELLLSCCSAPRWASEVAAGRPYATVAQLGVAAEDALTDSDVVDGLTGHPRIGERSSDPRSSREQSKVSEAGEDVLSALAEGNRAYEERFGHVYLVCASGRGAEELLAVLRDRLDNDPATEWRVVRAELAAINRLRLARVLGEQTAVTG
ncbi:2-oxo-4-hydroxy-4-carboxy-5-ureidoimidazoline decarboxylase [Pseudonocardia spinosispora]|uniref:2-oxo-4-hydroxy-4-carboxy-5-ureidoimidazoline decarboxylase n=1 Tax=Pseudonocardia spinosispora TaxID=103441 RepID=UPI000420FB77|nr:2-oxo-4-hydroxy-4-carboxy-5-ureidoimidazoline decarboxylase [Pseudonocardia spinosispora]